MISAASRHSLGFGRFPYAPATTGHGGGRPRRGRSRPRDYWRGAGAARKLDVRMPAEDHRRTGLAARHASFRPTRQRECRSEEHTSELQSLMRISYAVFCLKKKKTNLI